MRTLLLTIVLAAAPAVQAQVTPEMRAMRDVELDSIDQQENIAIVLYAVSIPALLAAVAPVIWTGVAYSDASYGGGSLDIGTAGALLALFSGLAGVAGIAAFVALGLDVDGTSRRRAWEQDHWGTQTRLRLAPGPGQVGLGLSLWY